MIGGSFLAETSVEQQYARGEHASIGCNRQLGACFDDIASIW